MKKFLVLTCMAVMMMSFAGGLQAAVLDFAVNYSYPGTGSISYDGGAAPLIGEGISVNGVTGGDTLYNSGVYAPIVDGVLDFTTGNRTGYTDTSWTFGGGDSSKIILTGGVDFNGGGISDGDGDIALGTTLFSGTFGSATVSTEDGGYRIAGSSFTDKKNTDLAAFFGLSNVTDWAGNFNISFIASDSPPAGFTSSSMGSGDIYNRPAPVPEPGTMMLLGSGLIGLAGWGRKKFRK